MDTGGSMGAVHNDLENYTKADKIFIPYKKCIKDYKVIGWGSCSDVIVSNEIGHNYAIKRVVKSILNSKEIGYFFNEMCCLKKISCSSIVSMKSVFQTELTYNLVLEKGENDLHCFSEGIKYSADRVDKIKKDLCNAVEYIHNIGIYHRDIKPENVIIFEETYKLCDFGLAVMDGDMGKGSVGSIGFYSPEMSSDVAYSRKYADYWSLGCVLLEQIIGNDVFTSEWLEVCYKKISGSEQANICNDFLKNYYNKSTKIDWSDVKCLLNLIPNNRILPHKVRRRTTSLDRIIKIMERNKILSKKYEKIHPIED